MHQYGSALTDVLSVSRKVLVQPENEDSGNGSSNYSSSTEICIPQKTFQHPIQ